MPKLDEVLRQISASDKPYYVYALCLSDGTPFYIGKGSAGRVAAHENEVNETAALTTKHEILDHLKRSGQDVQYELLGLFELESDAFRYEVTMIAKYGRLDNGTGILTNRSNGGEGQSRQYGPEVWELDLEGIVTAKEVQSPSQEDLAAPRFRRWAGLTEVPCEIAGHSLTTDEQWEAFERECKNPTGNEMPLLSQWQEAGLTLQVFYASPTELHADIGVAIEDRKRFGGNPKLRVRFRLFEGRRLLIEDSTAFTPELLSNGTRMVASLLDRLSSLPEPINGHVRFDAKYGTRDYSKRLRAWFAYNGAALKRHAQRLIADLPVSPPPIQPEVSDIMPPPVSDPRRNKLDRFVRQVLLDQGLREALADELHDDDKRDLILFDFAAGEKIDRPGKQIGKTSWTAFFDWANSQRSPQQVREQWDSQFPADPLPTGVGFVRVSVLRAMRLLRDLHGDP